MTKQEAISELTRAADLCPTTPLAEACRTLIAWEEQPHDCGTCKHAPTVDAVPVKHGRWIYHPDWQADGECGYECSECGMGSDVDYPYCMLCGARMEREGR